jgi:cytochrome c2
MKNSLLRIIGVVSMLTVVLILEVVTMKGQPTGQAVPSVKSEVPPAADNPINNGSDSGVSKIVDAPSKGDPARGKKVFNTFQPLAGMACNACHRVDTEDRLVGPGLLNVGERALHRVDGLSAQAYIRQSIIDPTSYVVDGYSDIMPKTFGEAFNADQLDDLVAYLMSLK